MFAAPPPRSLSPSRQPQRCPHVLDHRFRERFGIEHIDAATLASFAGDDTRSLHVLDVRTPEEFEAGHRPGSRLAPSWDVAPWVFRYVGTHNARVVLVDNDGVRATVAASRTPPAATLSRTPRRSSTSS